MRGYTNYFGNRHSHNPTLEAFRAGRIDARYVARGEPAERIPSDNAPASVRQKYREGWNSFRSSVHQLIADIELGGGVPTVRDPGECPI